ncbi:MAG TPA: hypothetical protein VG873_11665 [Burkholderiales bacterium]|nr:hypothetical protein [Burkholderiales bacterium]
MRIFLPLLLAVSGAPAWAAYDANGVQLGASEKDVKKAFPAAYCKPLEWTSPAADRRCDDAKASFGGVEGRLTVYLKKDAVQAFDLRFESRDATRLAGFLKKRYGAPATEVRDPFTDKDGKVVRETYKVVWENGKDRAALVAQIGGKRSQLTVTRGKFEEEIYRLR